MHKIALAEACSLFQFSNPNWLQIKHSVGVTFSNAKTDVHQIITGWNPLKSLVGNIFFERISRHWPEGFISQMSMFAFPPLPPSSPYPRAPPRTTNHPQGYPFISNCLTGTIRLVTLRWTCFIIVKWIICELRLFSAVKNICYLKYQIIYILCIMIWDWFRERNGIELKKQFMLHML